jgi:hypothetical protein
MIRKSFVNRASDRSCIFVVALASIAGSIVLALVPPRAIAEDTAGTIRAGDRVVLRSETAALRFDDREVARSRRENHVHRALAVNGAIVKVKAEGDCIIGEVPQTDLV